MLTIISVAPKRGRRIYVLCKCDCGKEKEIRLDGVISGKIESCNCFQKTKVSECNTTHGLSGHPLHKTWRNIKGRCYNPKSHGFEHWGGRGIIICDEWLNEFKLFYDWCIGNGWKKGLSIDRINNNGNYEPLNCRIVTHQENNCNTRLINVANNSGYRGVCYDKRVGFYRGYVNYKKKRIFDSNFSTAKQAAIARDIFCIKNNIPLPLNFPELQFNQAI